MGVVRNFEFVQYVNGSKSQSELADDKDSQDCLSILLNIGPYPFLLFSLPVLHFLVVASLLYINLTHVHVKIASLFVSHRLL